MHRYALLETMGVCCERFSSNLKKTPVLVFVDSMGEVDLFAKDRALDLVTHGLLI